MARSKPRAEPIRVAGKAKTLAQAAAFFQLRPDHHGTRRVPDKKKEAARSACRNWR